MAETAKVTNINPDRNIHQRMADILTEVEFIAKGQKNSQQGFMYRGIDDIYNSLHGLFGKHGVYVCPEVLEKTREERPSKNGGVLAFTSLRMKYTFYAPDGSNVFCVVEGEGMDSGDKSSNKAMAVAHKYALLQVFMIPTNEVKDPDADSPELGAGPSVKDAEKRSAKITQAVLENYESIMAIKESLFNEDYSEAAQLLWELNPEPMATEPVELMQLLFTAPTKGGPFTPSEREAIRAQVQPIIKEMKKAEYSKENK